MRRRRRRKSEEVIETSAFACFFFELGALRLRRESSLFVPLFDSEAKGTTRRIGVEIEHRRAPEERSNYRESTVADERKKPWKRDDGKNKKSSPCPVRLASSARGFKTLFQQGARNSARRSSACLLHIVGERKRYENGTLQKKEKK